MTSPQITQVAPNVSNATGVLPISAGGTGAVTALAVAMALGLTAVVGNQGLDMVVLGTATYGSNGAGTLTTALAATPAITKCFAYVPANSVSASFAAGWYYCVFSSTTAFVLFNNQYSGTGTLLPPASPTAFVATGQGSVAGVSSSVTAYQLSIPGNTLGLSGGLNVEFSLSYTNAAGTKTVAVSYGAMTFLSTSGTTTVALAGGWGFKNAGATNLQRGKNLNTNSDTGTSANAIVSGTVDSTTNQTVAFTLTNATPASDNLVLLAGTIILLPSVT